LINECNLDATTIMAYRAMYTGMTSCVRYQGELTRWFSVRQGAKSSPMLYLLNINELINALESSEYGLYMYTVLN